MYLIIIFVPIWENKARIESVIQGDFNSIELHYTPIIKPL